ncbi:MAG: type IV pilus modification protein PilV [Sedimenticolaceae bacterium]
MNQKGFTLLEVLIAALVLSLGLLGTAGMQIISLKNTNSAYQRAQATQLAYDIIDRMRANRDEAEKSDSKSKYAIAYGGKTYAASSLPDCETKNCDSGTMAGYDVANWKVALAATLPSGDGSVSIDTASKMVTVDIRWDDVVVEFDSEDWIQSRKPLTLSFRTEL